MFSLCLLHFIRIDFMFLFVFSILFIPYSIFLLPSFSFLPSTYPPPSSALLPSRYSRVEPFTALNVDIRNQQHLFESLDAFVKGDLLEGANAYHCEKCDKKVSIFRLVLSVIHSITVRWLDNSL